MGYLDPFITAEIRSGEIQVDINSKGNEVFQMLACICRIVADRYLECVRPGTPVVRGRVFFSEGWAQQAETSKKLMCAEYCRWPREYDGSDDFYEIHCYDCPMDRLTQIRP